MGDAPKTKKTSSNNKRSSRPTIGLLTGRLGDVGYAAQIWPGVAKLAEERDVNLICFVGGAIQGALEFDTQRNAIYELASPENVDGLIVMASSIGRFVGPEYLAHFYERFGPIPIVNIAMSVGDRPTILVDNRSGMREMVSHLVEEHNYRRIAFIRGPETNNEAQERYHTYLETLAEYGLPVNPDLTVPGDFLTGSGTAAIRTLLDERRVDFDALVSVNDEMALGAILELQNRGIQVPHQIPVTGFDDLLETKFFSPPLTTVRQPFFEQGRLAAEQLLSMLEGKTVPLQTVLPTHQVIRQSCGCFPSAASHRFHLAAAMEKPVDASKQRQLILTQMAEAAGQTADTLGPDWAEKLLDAFGAVVKEPSPHSHFMQAWDHSLRQVARECDDVIQWQEVLDVLHYSALPFFSGKASPPGLDDLWERSLGLIGEIAQWAQANRRLQADRRAFEFSTRFSEPLMSSFDVSALTNVVADQLPQMGITSCYLALYERTGKTKSRGPSKWSRLILAYNQGGRMEFPVNGLRFPSCRLVPAGFLPREKRFAVMLEPLHFRDEIQLGFIILEPLKTQQGALREELSRQISIALKGALLLQEKADAQKALKDSEEKYKSLLQFNNEILRNAPIGIIRLDKEMRIEYENPELEKIIGLPPGAAQSRAMGTDIRKLPGIQKAGLVLPLNDLQKGKTIAKETVFDSIYGKQTTVKVNGCPIRKNGKSVGSVLLVEDITVRKQAEDALAGSEERYRSLAEASHDMIYIIARDGTIEYLNGFAARQFHTSPERISGKKMDALFPGPTAGRQKENIQKVLETNVPFYIEAPTVFPQGETWLGTWLVPLKDSAGQVTSVMGVSRDITERKNAEKELKEYSEKLEEMVGERTAELQDALIKAQAADRLKSEFLANVNHELRTPLTNLILYYQMLSAYPMVKTKERLEVIGRELQRLRNLIENLLNLSRLELEQMAFRIKPHDINQLVQNLVNDRRAMAEERGLMMVLELAPNLPPICMDEAMVIQAISNLLTNAINYTPAGGQMYIRTEELPDNSGNKGMVLSVQDTGPGINPQDLPHIFERFYRGSAGFETGSPGTGLGLSIVKEVVERHHGQILVENVKEGHGAIFSIWLPVEQPQSAGAQTMGNS